MNKIFKLIMITILSANTYANDMILTQQMKLNLQWNYFY